MACRLRVGSVSPWATASLSRRRSRMLAPEDWLGAAACPSRWSLTDSGDIAKATGAEVGTVTSWARATRQPSAAFRDCLLDLIAIVDRLSRTMDQKYIPLWLNKPLSALGDERPLVAQSAWSRGGRRPRS